MSEGGDFTLVAVIRVSSSEWCSASLEEHDMDDYTVEKIDLRKLGLKGVSGERIDSRYIIQRHPDADIVILLECEFDYPHIILVYYMKKRILHYLKTDHNKATSGQPDAAGF